MKVADDKFLKNNGVDAHRIKKDFLGAKAEIKLYDIYVDKKLGNYGLLEKAVKAKAFQPVNTSISRINHG
ncbi:polymorphic toxin type 33 domain-containing protein [Cronobacter dublinensis]